MFKALLDGAGKLWKALAEKIRSLHISRRAWGRIGYYAALAALLALLGSASYSYRTGRQDSAGEPAEPPEAVSAQAPAVSPMPVPTQPPERWVWPLEGEIVGDYSPQGPVWSETLGQWQTHAALDIAGSPGEAVYACHDGTVLDAWSDRLWGNVVVIDHGDGYQSTYAGMNTLQMASVGDAVKAGQVIGSVGNSAACEAERGWHLHFELTLDGAPADFGPLASAGEPQRDR